MTRLPEGAAPVSADGIDAHRLRRVGKLRLAETTRQASPPVYRSLKTHARLWSALRHPAHRSAPISHEQHRHLRDMRDPARDTAEQPSCQPAPSMRADDQHVRLPVHRLAHQRMRDIVARRMRFEYRALGRVVAPVEQFAGDVQRALAFRQVRVLDRKSVV